MKSFLQRCLPWLFAKPSPAPRPAEEAAATVPDAERRAPMPTDQAQARTTAEVTAIGARRPLIAADGSVAGFEFRINEGMARYLKRDTDAQARADRVTALLMAAQATARTGRIGFARMPAPWLVHAATQAELGPGVMIGLETMLAVVPIPQSSTVIEQVALTLRAKGVKLGWGPDFDARIPPDFVLLRQGATAMSTLLETRSSWPPAWQTLPVVVTDISNVEELEMALYNGVAYACGVLERDSAPTANTSPVPPQVRRIGLLLNQLVAGADTSVIVDEIKGDIGLSYRLLRLIHNASYAQLGSQASVEQAVLLLGRYELYRWLSMLLVDFTGSRKMGSALQEATLWRSRLLELIATEKQLPTPDQFFTLGMASMLGQLMRISDSEVASTLNLSAPARQALLERSGPWYPYLNLVRRLEAHILDLTVELSPLFQDTAHLLMLSDQAWRWAAQQTALGNGAGVTTGFQDTAPQA